MLKGRKLQENIKLVLAWAPEAQHEVVVNRLADSRSWGG